MEFFNLDFLEGYILLFIGQSIFFIALIQMAYQRRSPTSMMAWILAFILFPYFSIPFYFFVGLRKHHYNKAQVLYQNDTSTGKDSIFPPPTNGNRFELYTTGELSYAKLMTQIEKASKSIYVTMYKLDVDESTQPLLDLLAEKAKQGVKVKILVDALGSIQLYIIQYKLKEIRNSGVEISFFMPIVKMPFRNYVNLRNHRKAFIFDESSVIAGGMNLTDTYMGKKKKQSRWQDILFLIEGSAALSYVNVFTADWEYATGEKIIVEMKKIPDYGNVDIEVIPSGPDVKEDPLYETFLKKIYAAKKRIWIVTPYFTPDENIFYALKVAKHSGVDVRLITPRDSDHWIADMGRSSFMRELEERDIYVALYEGSMLHAKALIIDDDIGILGSANVSYRSMFLNYEIMSFFYSKEVVFEIESWMLQLLKSSTRELKKSGKIRRIGENLMKVFIPLL